MINLRSTWSPKHIGKQHNIMLFIISDLINVFNLKLKTAYVQDWMNKNDENIITWKLVKIWNSYVGTKAWHSSRKNSNHRQPISIVVAKCKAKMKRGGNFSCAQLSPVARSLDVPARKDRALKWFYIFFRRIFYCPRPNRSLSDPNTFGQLRLSDVLLSGENCCQCEHFPRWSFHNEF